MRKTVLALAALLLMSLATPAWAQTKPGSGGSSAPGSEPVAPPDTGPNLFPGEIHISSDGEAVEQAPAGKAARVTVEVYNGGTETARDITAHIEAVGGATVSDADSSVADVEPDKTSPARFTVTADESSCQDFAAFLITFTYSGGKTESKFGVPVACPGPRLSIQQVLFSGGDGDGVPEPGETIRAFIVLSNEGRDPATNVTARVTVSGKSLETVSDDLAWDDIAPGATGKSTTPIVIEIPKDAPQQDPCPGPIFGVAPDTTVSSDGSSGGSGTASSGNVSSPSSGAPEPAPDQSPNGAVEIQPAPAGTVTPEPAPTASDDPIPAPPPGATTPEPLPEPTADQPVGMEMTVAARATGYSENLGYGNGIACAVDAVGGNGGVPPLGAAPRSGVTRDSALASEKTASRSGGSAFPIAIVVVAAFAAITGRRLLVG